MRFKQRSPRLPDINLIPLIDVLMTVLTFFILVTMILGEERQVALTLPKPGQSAPAKPVPSLIVQLDDRGDILVNGRTMAEPQLMLALETYLADSPKGAVLLNPHPDLPYDQVIQTLAKIQELAGDRVSLALGATP
jgi:biopolymer transport protein ExbD